MTIKFLFTCGHEMEATGKEQDRPTCPIDGSPLERVTAPKPRIVISDVPWTGKLKE